MTKELTKDKFDSFTNVEVRTFLRQNLFMMSLQLQTRIILLDQAGKGSIFWTSLFVTGSILCLSYFSSLVEYFPIKIGDSNDGIYPLYNFSAKLLGVEYQDPGPGGSFCIASNLFFYVVLFFMSVIDVYVIKVMKTLEENLQKQRQYFQDLAESDNKHYTENEKNIEIQKQIFEDKENEQNTNSTKLRDKWNKIIRINAIRAQALRRVQNIRMNNAEKQDQLNTSIDKEIELIEMENESSLSSGEKTLMDASDLSEFKNLKTGNDSQLMNEKFQHALSNFLFGMKAKEMMRDSVTKQAAAEFTKQKRLRYEDLPSMQEIRQGPYVTENQVTEFKFYEIGEPDEEEKFNCYYKTDSEDDENSLNVEDLQSDDSGSDDSESVEQAMSQVVDMNSSKSHILSYYFRNLAKFQRIQRMKFFFYIQLKIIATSIVLVLFSKKYTFIILVYFSYIIFFYFSNPKEDSNNVRILNVTAIFLVLVTGVQYIGLLLSQKLEMYGKNDMIYLHLLESIGITLSDSIKSFLVQFGLNDQDPSTLIWEVLPVMIFQFTIFYFDSFVNNVAQQIENSSFKISKPFIYRHPIENILIVEYKKWKNVTFKLMQNFQNNLIVRINEIQIAMQFLINLFTVDKFYNLVRIIILIVYFYIVGFSQLSEVKKKRGQIKVVLVCLTFFIWFRIFFDKITIVLRFIIEIAQLSGQLEFLDFILGKKDENSSSDGSSYSDGISIYLVVLELFIVEIISELYQNDDFIEKQNNIIDKKLLKSQLISHCMTYDINEKKLIGVINGYREKLQRSRNIQKMVEQIDKWTRQIVEKQNSEVPHESDKTIQEDLKAQENLHKLYQIASFKPKVIFYLYQLLIKSKNPFLFKSTLELYDYICLRNKEIVTRRELYIDMIRYLKGEHTNMHEALLSINSVYKNYSKEVKEYGYTRFKHEKIKRIPRKRESIAKMKNKRSFMNKPFSNGRQSQIEMSGYQEGPKVSHQDFIAMEKRGEYDFKIVQIKSNKIHKFHNPVIDDESNTNKYQKIKIRVLIYLIVQIFISRWHYICYFIIMLYCFMNGGFSGFLFIFLLLTYVFISEKFPSFIFWRLSVYNACFMMILKLTFSLLYPNIEDDTSSYRNQYLRNLILGSLPYQVESLILIAILFQLILLDEIGLKDKRFTEIEDTSTAYVRMRLNNVFKLRETGDRKKKELYLSSLHSEVSNEGSSLMKKNNTQLSTKRRNALSSRRRMKNTHIQNDLNKSQLKEKYSTDQINLNEILKYENRQKDKQFREFTKASKQVDYIFMRSFSMFNSKNKKSFRWSHFSIYLRKPGMDLSIIINSILMIFLAYNIFFISYALGFEKNFLTQLNSSIIQSKVVYALIASIFLLILERIIYKRNPSIWRKHFQIDQNEVRKPQNLKQIRQSIKEKLEEGVPLELIRWKELEVKEKEMTEREIMKLNRIKNGQEKDDNFKHNPLYTRYQYQIVLTFFSIIVFWIVLPQIKNSHKQGDFWCTRPEDCTFFQNDNYIRIQFLFLLLYLILSALQIRFGEPINKGKRVIKSSHNKLFYLMNKILIIIPFFFSITTSFDYVLTSTSLEFWEYLKFESIYQSLYVAIYRMQQRDRLILGSRFSFIKKLPYCLLSFLLVSILIGPFLLFGNYFSSQNLVTQASLEIDIKLGEKLFNLYQSTYIKNIESFGNYFVNFR